MAEKRHPLKGVYGSMITRCYNPKRASFKNYGGRGIQVCDRWRGRGGILRFAEDMGPRPSPRHTLERRNNDGHYCPENCYWAPRRTQTRNRRSTCKITYLGESRPIAEWADITGISYNVVRQRLRKGWSVQDTLETPVAPRGKPLTVFYDDRVWTCEEIAEKTGVSRQGIVQRIQSGWSAERIFNTPYRQSRC